jgi:hypothetical protein
MKSNLNRLMLLPVALFACASALQAAEVKVTAPDSPMLRFALGKLESALQQRGDATKRLPPDGVSAQPDVVVLTSAGVAMNPGPEGFSLARRDGRLHIAGGDERGAMYGVLDVAEQIRMGTPWNKIQERTVKAQFEFRAIKFNLPWAAYRTSPAIEQHDATCRDLKFWEAFLDMMVENRFNVLSLWSLHPFHYMVRPKNFPEACPFTDAELAEWRTLWRGLLAMAKERGIDGMCLLGEVPAQTSRMANPVAALAILKVFTRMLGIEIDTTELAETAREIMEQVKQATAIAMGEYLEHFTQPIWEQGDGEHEEEDDEGDDDEPIEN